MAFLKERLACATMRQVQLKGTAAVWQGELTVSVLHRQAQVVRSPKALKESAALALSLQESVEPTAAAKRAHVVVSANLISVRYRH